MSTNRKKRPTSNPRSTSAINDKVKVTVSLTADTAQKVEALAKQLGVSKSELFERFAQEELNPSPEATNTAETKPTVNIESSATDSENANLKQQVEEKDKIIQQLQQQVARISELETQLENTVKLEIYEDLKREAEQQKQTLADLQNQLQPKETTTVKSESYQALQEEVEQQKSTIAQLKAQLTRISELEEQLKTAISAETHQALQNELEQQRNIQAQLNQQIEALQKELHERHRSWAQLQTKEEKIAELEGKLAHSISKENYQQLEQICANQKMQIATIEKKLASLISPIQHQDETKTTANNYDALKNYMQEQDQLINVLQKRVLELQGLASFGESQLSKWRNRTFNS